LTVGACAFPPPLPLDLPETFTTHRRPVENATDLIAKADWVNAEPVSLVMAEYSLTPNQLVLNEGRAYRLVLLNLGDKMHAMNAPQFFRAIAVQKVEVSRGDYKAFPHAHRDTSSTVFETARRLQRLTVEEIEAPPPLTGEDPDAALQDEKDEETGGGEADAAAAPASPAAAPAKGASPAVKAAPQTPVGGAPAPAAAKNGANGDSRSDNGAAVNGKSAATPANGAPARGNGTNGRKAANGASSAAASEVEKEIEDDAPALPGTPPPTKVATPRPKLPGEGREIEDESGAAQEPLGVEDDDTVGPRRLPRFKAKAPEPVPPAAPAAEAVAQPPAPSTPVPRAVAEAPAADDLSEAPVADDLAEDVKPADSAPATASPTTATPPPTAAETRPVKEKPVAGAAPTTDPAPPKPVAAEPLKTAPKPPAAKAEPKISPTERGLARERPASIEGAAPTLGGEGEEIVEELSEREFATLIRTGQIEVPAGRARTVYFVAVRKGRYFVGASRLIDNFQWMRGSIVIE
jgi:hypothetical protein